MSLCHDFWNGEYYEDFLTGETCSVEEYNKKQWEEELRRKGQHHILISKCESLINKTTFICDIYRWHYNASEEKKPSKVIILSENEYIKNQNKEYYYRSYEGDHYLSLKVKMNIRLKVDKIEEIHGFLIVHKKGRGILYTKEQFKKEFL